LENFFVYAIICINQGEKKMIAWAFFSTLISTVLKMLFIGVFAVGGVFAGKKLRKRKDAKNSETK